MSETDDLRRRIDDLTDRVSALEAAPSETPQDALPPDTFWALTELQRRRPDDTTTADGSVMIVGSLDLPGGEVAWQEEAGTAGLLDDDWYDLADAVAALGHPVRLELLRRILGGTHSTADLAATEGLGTTGQLHHHLRQLKAAGWVHQTGRGTYDVPARRVVPLLTTILGVRR